MYTGEWGSEGKLAILHEKELVLNKEDTANMLKMLEIVREDYLSKLALSTVNSPTFTQADMLAAMSASSASAMEQQITISAEFPNAVYHSEIEEAFNNMINMAS
jgi:hypothetical protein